MKKSFINYKSFTFYITFSLVISFAVIPTLSYAESYRWTDENGVLHFSDRKPPVKEKKVQAKAVIKKVPKKKRHKKNRLFDFREKVVNIIGVDKILLESGKIVKYVGVGSPAGFLKNNGMGKRILEAEAFHGDLVIGKTVTVLLGRKNKNRKRYYLGHVFLGQEAFINAELIRKGYAITEEFPSDFEYQSLFLRLQKDAQSKGVGLWHF